MSEIVTVDEYWGTVYVSISREHTDTEHRWWFDVSSEGDLVFISEVIEWTDITETGRTSDGRHYVDESYAEVTDRVVDVLDEWGFDGEIYEAGRETAV